MAEYLRESDVELTEETETIRGDDSSVDVTVCWTAHVRGRLFNSAFTSEYARGGTMVEMSRSGATAQEAMMSLRRALEKQGWGLQ